MYKAVGWIGLAFFLLYSGFNALQALLPHSRPTAGPLSIALGYIAYAVAALLPAATDQRRLVFVGSGLTFLLWIFSTQLSDAWLAVASVLNGAGAGLLWVNEGAWVAELAGDSGKVGRCSSIVLICFHLSTVGGLATVYWVPDLVPYIAALTSLIANLLLLATPTQWLFGSPPGAEPVQCSEFETLRNLVTSPWKHLLPSIGLFGCSSAMVWVGLPRLLTEKEISIGFTMFAFSSVLAFALFGQLADRVGKLPLFFGSTLVQFLTWASVILIELSVWRVYICLLITAFSNAALNQAIVCFQAELPAAIRSRSFSWQVAIYCLFYASSAAVVVLSMQVVAATCVVLAAGSAASLSLVTSPPLAPVHTQPQSA